MYTVSQKVTLFQCSVSSADVSIFEQNLTCSTQIALVWILNAQLFSTSPTFVSTLTMQDCAPRHINLSF